MVNKFYCFVDTLQASWRFVDIAFDNKLGLFQYPLITPDTVAPYKNRVGTNRITSNSEILLNLAETLKFGLKEKISRPTSKSFVTPKPIIRILSVSIDLSRVA